MKQEKLGGERRKERRKEETGWMEIYTIKKIIYLRLEGKE
jgi:hypothetical protein